MTRVVIAHRLSTIWQADRVIVLERGRIVQSGRFDELMAMDVRSVRGGGVARRAAYCERCIGVTALPAFWLHLSRRYAAYAEAA